MGDKRPEVDAPKRAGFYLSQVNFREAWTLLKEGFALQGCLVFAIAIVWLLWEFSRWIIPEEISRGAPNIPNWVWIGLVILILWSEWGGRKITIPRFSKERLLLVSIGIGGGYLILEYLPHWIGIPILFLAMFLLTFVQSLVIFGKRKYEGGIGPADRFGKE